MTRIVVMIEGGLLTGVFSDGCVDDIDVQLIDYDNIKCDERIESELEAKKVEEEIEAGVLKSCWQQLLGLTSGPR